MKAIILALLTLPLIGQAQQKVHFEHDFNAAQQKAKQVNKPLLVAWFANEDEALHSNVFHDEYVARFLQKHVVAVKWVGDKKNATRVLGDLTTAPVSVVLEPNGQAIHRVVENNYPLEYLRKIDRSLDSATQYYPAVARFNQGERDAALLKTLIIGAADAHDTKHTDQYFEAYVAAQSAPLDMEHIRFITKYATSTNWAGFDKLLIAAGQHENETVTSKIASLIFDELFVPQLANKKVDVVSLVTAAKSKYPYAYLMSHMDGMAVEFCEMQENWTALQAVLPQYIASYKDELTPGMLNYYAQLVQIHLYDNLALVSMACDWSRQSIERTNAAKPEYLETYAKLLMRAGLTADTQAWADKARAIQRNSDISAEQVLLVER